MWALANILLICLGSFSLRSFCCLNLSLLNSFCLFSSRLIDLFCAMISFKTNSIFFLTRIFSSIDSPIKKSCHFLSESPVSSSFIFCGSCNALPFVQRSVYRKYDQSVSCLWAMCLLRPLFDHLAVLPNNLYDLVCILLV